MEVDRAQTNLGPDSLADSEVQDSAVLTSKIPRKRFIGRRAAAERAATKGVHATGDDGSSGALEAPKPARAPRTLNQIPREILEDQDLQAALAHLPSNYSFEIPKTIHRIRSSGAKNIALQFPEGLLMFAPLISDILTRFCPGTDTLIMGDVTYGACCIDDYTARALGCDLLVHYGHSCLVPMDQTGGMKTLYVFVTIGIDFEHLIRTIEANFQSGKKIALVGTIQFNATLHAIVPRLRTLGFEAILPRSSPLSAGEILGCTAPTLTATSKTESSDQGTVSKTDADMILYVGDGRFHLESILIASPSLRAHTYRYDPYSRRLTHETYEHEEMHSLRSHAIQTSRKAVALARSKQAQSMASPDSQGRDDPITWGIILGTLGRQGNPHTLSLITAHLTRLGVPYITLLLSEIQPTKLSLMSRDVGVWVQIACPRLSIDWGYAFERPLLSPYEAMVALEIKESGPWLDDQKSEDVDASLNVLTRKPSGPRAAGRDLNAVYPMDFYGKDGLGRTRVEDVPSFGLEIEVT